MIDLPSTKTFQIEIDITSQDQIILYSNDILVRFNFPLDIVQPTKYVVENFIELFENHIKNLKEGSDY